ncbi:MAG: serine/threonine protein kinase [Myxococcales bacterium]|nr:serine/threonine protein kinase [Myxococcales bacterium]
MQFGKYVLLDRISIGGMAEVFKAKSEGPEGFEKVIAVKKILPALVKDKEFIAMFVDEAKIAGQLNQENICPIYELGKVGEAYYIAMEHIWGKDLLQIINRFRRMRKFMPPVMVAWIASKVCSALDYAHNKSDSKGMALNIVHRDVSPQNVLVGYEGQVKLIDFGIAKAASRNTRTRAGVLKGKFGYMSPEQVRGAELDPRSDIFTVGTCMWEMAVCSRLFLGESDFSTLEKVRRAKVVNPSSKVPGFPPELEAIIMRALEREPGTRFQSAREMQESLQHYLRQQTPPYGTSTLASWMKTAFTQEVTLERERFDKIMGAVNHPSDFSAAAIAVGGKSGRTSENSPNSSTVKLDSSEIKLDEFEGETAPEGAVMGRRGNSDNSLMLDQPTFIFFSAPPRATSPVEGESMRRPLPAPPPVPEASSIPLKEQTPAMPGRPYMPPSKAAIQVDKDGSWKKAVKPRHEPSASWKIPAMDGPLGGAGLIAQSASSRKRKRIPRVALLALLGAVLLGGVGWGVNVWFLVPHDGALTVRTVPPTKAAVLIDGKIVGHSPLHLREIKAGMHQLEIRAEGFARVVRRVHIKSDWMAELEFALTPLDRPQPARADLKAALPIPPKEAAQSNKQAAAPQETPAEIPAETPTPERAEEDSAAGGPYGYLTLRSSPSSRIYVDGVDTKKSTPERRLRLSAGVHRIELRMRDGRVQAFDVHIRAGERTRVKRTF